MRRRFLPIILVTLAMGCAAAEPKPEAAAPETDDQKTLYALGVALAAQLGGVKFDAAEVKMIQMGLSDGIQGVEPQVAMEVYGPKLNALIKTRMEAAMNEEKQASQAFCDQMAKQDGAQKTESGAIYIETKAGEGENPKTTDRVKVHYHGTLRDGTVFDSSVDRGEPATFSISGVVPCFREGLMKMKPGGKAKLVCPSDTAYGDRGSPPKIKPGAAISFDVELLEIVPSE